MRRGRGSGSGRGRCWSRTKHRRTQHHENKQDALFCRPPTTSFVLRPPPNSTQRCQKRVSSFSQSRHSILTPSLTALKSTRGLSTMAALKIVSVSEIVHKDLESEETDGRFHACSLLIRVRKVSTTHLSSLGAFSSRFEFRLTHPSRSSPPSLCSPSSLPLPRRMPHIVSTAVFLWW